MSAIYALCDPTTREVRYVGKTIGSAKKRQVQHESDARRGVARQRRLSAWLRSIGCTSLLVILEHDPAHLDQAECDWIALLRTAGARLCNMTDGGDGQRPGWSPSVETRRRLSESHTGLVRSESHCQALSKAQLGRKVSPETRAKIAVARRGQKPTPEHRAKLSEARRGERNPFFGRSHSDETRRRIGEASRERRHTDETKARMAEANRGRRHTPEARAKISAAKREWHAARRAA